MGPDPSLYASTGSWAGLPYDTPSYGPPPGGGGYYSYAAPAAEYGPPGGYGPPPPMPPMPPMGGPPADGVYSSFRPTGPARMVGSSMVGGGPPPGGGYMSYGMPPPGYQYGDPYGPPAQPRQKVYGVGILFSEQTDPTGRIEVVVKDVYQGTPAADSGRVKPGDVLKAVQGRPVDGRSIRELRAYVPGPLGSSVSLGFEGPQGPYDVDLERVQSGRGAPTVYGGGRAQRQAPPPPQSTEGKAYVGFSVQQSGDPRNPEYIVANVTAESTADQQGLTQGDKIQAIDNKDIRGMHEEEVKQMLIGEPFSTVQIVTASKTVDIERDCAVPEPEAGGPIVGGGNMYASYGGYQSMAMPVPPQQPAYSPPRGYSMYAPSYPVTYGAPSYTPPVTYAQAPTQAISYAGGYGAGYAPVSGYAPVPASGPPPTPSYSYAAPAGAYGPGPGYGAQAGYYYEGAPQYGAAYGPPRTPGRAPGPRYR